MHLRNFLTLAGIAAALVAGPQSIAQQQGQGGGQERPGRGNFDPEQMRQRMMERYREQLEIKSDDEWKIIEERVVKVNEARRDAGSGRGGFAMMRPNRGGGDGQGGGQGGNRGGGPGGFGGPQLPEAEDLQKAIDAKASADDIKAKLNKYREARKAKQANLTKAQDELRKVLSVRQEATAVLMGLLD